MDVTESSGLEFEHFNGMSGALYFPEMMGSGVALIDYDGDGDMDVYLVQGHMLGPEQLKDAIFAPKHTLPLTDRLYRNDTRPGAAEMKFTDVTEASGLAAHGYGMGVAAADYDNDGDVDLYVTNYGPNELWRNKGDGTFEQVTDHAGVNDSRWSVSASWVDYDRDGWLIFMLATMLITPSGMRSPAAHRPVQGTIVLQRCTGRPPTVCSAIRGMGRLRMQAILPESVRLRVAHWV